MSYTRMKPKIMYHNLCELMISSWLGHAQKEAVEPAAAILANAILESCRKKEQ